MGSSYFYLIPFKLKPHGDNIGRGNNTFKNLRMDNNGLKFESVGCGFRAICIK